MTSHSRAVLSTPPAARMRPSRLNAVVNIGSAESSSVAVSRGSRGSVMFHRYVRWLLLAMASNVPSGLNADW